MFDYLYHLVNVKIEDLNERIQCQREKLRVLSEELAKAEEAQRYIANITSPSDDDGHRAF